MSQEDLRYYLHMDEQAALAELRIRAESRKAMIKNLMEGFEKITNTVMDYWIETRLDDDLAQLRIIRLGLNKRGAHYGRNQTRRPDPPHGGGGKNTPP